MPKTFCAKYAGKLYCYDKVKNIVDVYSSVQLQLEACPGRVIEAFAKANTEDLIDLDSLGALERLPDLLRKVK